MTAPLSSPPFPEQLPESHSPVGIHLTLECGGCLPSLLMEKDALASALHESAEQAGARVVETLIHRFNPHGLSGVVVIAESHLAVHTWPEHGYASVDIYTCGDAHLAHRIADLILEKFKPERVTRQAFRRHPPLKMEKETSLK